jgi:holliday junction DNA helicase RuvA
VIASLRGTVQSVDEESLVLDVQGVGYELISSSQTLNRVAVGADIFFRVYTHVREDQLVLFGFLSKAEKDLFLSLLKVSGIGPRVAVKILGAATVEDIIEKIDAGDVRGLSQLPKVGKKTAETIILELKGKLIRLEDQPGVKAFSARGDIVSALVHLGFRVSDVEKVVATMDVSTSVEEGVRRGLQALSSP